MTKKIAVFCLLFCFFQGHTTSPIFKLCDAKMDNPLKAEECSEQAMAAFLEKACRNISRQLGFFSNETVTAKIKVKDDGSLRLRQLDSRYTTILEDQVEAWIELLDGKLLPNRHGEDEFTLSFKFGLPSTNEVDWLETDHLPTKPICKEFNGVGRRSCLMNALKSVIGDLPARDMQAYSRMEVIMTTSGQYVGVRFLSPVTTAMRKVNDSIALRFTRLSRQGLINPKPAVGQFIKVEYIYDNFLDSPQRRHFFKTMAPEFLASGDTTHYLVNLIQAASDFHKYRHLVSYLEEVIHSSGIDKSARYGGFASTYKLSLDSLFSRQYYFDERTNRRLQRKFQHAQVPGCPMDDSLGVCSSAILNEKAAELLWDKYQLDLYDEKFSDPRGPARYNGLAHQFFGIDVNSSEGYIGIELYLDKLGNLLYVDPVVQSHNPMYDEYLEAKKRQASEAELEVIVGRNISLLIIDAVSQITQFEPALLGGHRCQTKEFLAVKMGQP